MKAFSGLGFLCLGTALLVPGIFPTTASAQTDATGFARPHLAMNAMTPRPGSKPFFRLGRSQELRAALPRAESRMVGHGAFAPSSPGRSPANYIIVDAPGAGTGAGQGTFLQAVNSLMVSSGYYTDSSNNNHGFGRASDGTIASFDVDGPMSQTTPTWMNNNGVIVGNYIDQGTGAENGFALAPDGSLITISAGTETTVLTNVVSISDRDEIVGDYLDSNSVFHGFLLVNDAIESFDAPGAGTGAGQGTEGFDVNVAGTIVGVDIDANTVSHGFVRTTNGDVTTFDVQGAGSNAGQGTFALGENSKGAIVGYDIDAGNVYHGFIREPGGAITTFDAPDACKCTNHGTLASELNSKGNATGTYADANDAYHAFERANNGALTEYDAPGAGTGINQGTQGVDINKRNVISGWAVDGSSVSHGYLRTP
jgi:hypothetical protein